MKKITNFLVLSFAVIVSFIFINPANAEASTTSWKKVSDLGSSCKVRIWTDATTYTKKAKTVDFTIEQNGKCGKLHYEAWLKPLGLYTYVSPNVSGSFNYKTPIKKLSVDIPLYKKQGRDSVVNVQLWNTSRYIYPDVWSNVIHIHKQ